MRIKLQQGEVKPILGQSEKALPRNRSIIRTKMTMTRMQLISRMLIE
jgi:hypothetical protein